MDPAQIKREVESLIRHLGGPNDPALIDRHPHAVRRGNVLVKVPLHNDCLQRAVERAEAKAHKESSSLLQHQPSSLFPVADAGTSAAAATAELASARAAVDEFLRNVPPAPGSKTVFAARSSSPSPWTSPAADASGAHQASQHQQQRAHSAPRSGRDADWFVTPNTKRGGVISFKSKARLYLGRDFPCGAVDSPGPIYEQRRDGINTKNGVSFTKARRDAPDSGVEGGGASSGPCFAGIHSVGRQFLSQRENPGSVVFPKAMRFGEVKENERTRGRGKGPYNVPGPGAFLSDILHLPHPRGGRVSSTHQAFSFGVRHSHTEFVSPLHFADFQGRASPGPAYDVSGLERGVFPPSKAPTFGKGERVPLERRDRTPGPAHYGANGAPDASVTQIQGPAIRFARAGRLQKAGNDSPGPIYTPSYALCDRADHAAKIGGGGGPEEDGAKDRFEAGSRIFLGKGLGVDAVGCASPGPMYNPQQKWDGPEFSLQFKEKRVRQGPFPRPQRARFISEGLSKSENLGAHSPGPGAPYELPAVGIRSGKNAGVVCYSFGSSKTNRDAEVSSSSAAAQHQQQQNNTSAGSKRGNSPSKTRTTSASGHGSGIDGAMHAAIPFYSTDISVLSTTKPVRGAVSWKPTARKSPGRGDSAGDGTTTTNTNNNNRSGNNNTSGSKSPTRTVDGVEMEVRTDGRLYNPDVSIRYRSSPKFSFGTGDRSSAIWKTTDDSNTKLAAEVGTNININWSQVENQPHGPRIGGLSRAGF